MNNDISVFRKKPRNHHKTFANPEWMNRGVGLVGGGLSPDLSLGLAGVVANGYVGSQDPTGDKSLTLTGISSTETIGIVGFSTDFTYSLTGVEASMFAGTSEAGPETIVAITGISSSGADGTVVPSTELNRILSGVQATGLVGTQTSSGGSSYGDASFSNVVLLSHYDGVNASVVVYDHSASQKSPTVFGNSQITTSDLISGTGAIIFDGTGDYLQYADNADWTLAGDFTVEFWLKANTLSGFNSWISWNWAAGPDWAIYTNGTTFGLWIGPGTDAFVLSTTIATAQWRHCAVVRSSGTVRLYLDGNEVGAGYSNSTSWNPVTITIGANYSGGQPVNGWMDSLRVTVGTARYTSTFYPTFGTDSYRSSVVLQLHGNGTNGSTTFTDSSPDARTVTVAGNAQISSAQSKYGSGSMFFDGTGDYATTPWSGTVMGSADWTMEAWIYLTGYAVASGGAYLGTILSKDVVAVERSFLWGVYGAASSYDQLFFQGWGGGSYTNCSATYNFSLNTWYHVAACRIGSNVYQYINGVLTGGAAAFSRTVPMTAGNYMVGGSNSDVSAKYEFKGHIEDLRLTLGTARYTTTGPFNPQVPEFSADSSFDKVSLLLHADGTNGSTTFTDSSLSPKTLTAVGNAQISTTQNKFGGSSLLFDGTGDQITIPTSTAFGFGTAAWCIEAWVYPTSSPICAIVDTRSSGQTGANRFVVGLEATTRTLFCQVNATVYGNTGTAPGTSTWSHVALTYDGTTLLGFVNGSQVWSQTVSLSFDSTMPVSIGNTWNVSSGFNGHIDDLRITKGVARYTSGFTVRNGPFPNA